MGRAALGEAPLRAASWGGLGARGPTSRCPPTLLMPPTMTPPKLSYARCVVQRHRSLTVCLLSHLLPASMPALFVVASLCPSRPPCLLYPPLPANPLSASGPAAYLCLCQPASHRLCPLPCCQSLSMTSASPPAFYLDAAIWQPQFLVSASLPASLTAACLPARLNPYHLPPCQAHSILTASLPPSIPAAYLLASLSPCCLSPSQPQFMPSVTLPD